MKKEKWKEVDGNIILSVCTGTENYEKDFYHLSLQVNYKVKLHPAERQQNGQFCLHYHLPSTRGGNAKQEQKISTKHYLKDQKIHFIHSKSNRWHMFKPVAANKVV